MDETKILNSLSQPEQDSDVLTKRNLFSFSLGTVGRDMAYRLFVGYLLSFILFTKSLTSAQFAVISIIIAVSRIFDAVIDPIMGSIIDNTHTRWGKFKPWILAGVLSCAVVLIAVFSSSLDGWSFIYFLAVIYLLFSLTYSMNDISYWGMLPSLTSNQHGRNRLTSISSLCAGAGGAIISFLVPTFSAGDLTLGNGAADAYKYISWFVAVMFVGFQMLTLVGVKEKPLPPVTQKTSFSFKKLLKVIAKNDQLLWMVLIFIIYSTGTGVIGGGLSMTYIYFEFGYNGLLLTLFGVVGGVINVGINVFYPTISKKFTRSQLLRYALIAIMTGYALMLLIGIAVPTKHGTLKFALLMIANAFCSSGQGLFYLVMLILITNTVEYNEWKHGKREEGVIFSLRPFTAQFSSALTQLLVMLVYISVGVLQYTNKISDLENQASLQQIDSTEKAELIRQTIATVPEGKKIALLICLTVIPAIFIISAYTVYRKKYIIDEEKYAQILADIRARKQATEE